MKKLKLLAITALTMCSTLTLPAQKHTRAYVPEDKEVAPPTVRFFIF